MFLPDAFKPDVQKFFASPVGQAFMLALNQRRPRAIDGTTPHSHTLLDSYAKRDGYDACVGEIAKLPFESANQPDTNTDEAILLSAKD